MSSFQSWKEPLPFIITEHNTCRLKIEDETASLLEKITQPVVVVAIAGSYRTGKSYLMNRLALKQKGFPLGSELQSKTKGIWIWCVNHPLRSNTVLVLIDTEGLNDPEKNDEQNDMMLFSLAVLLSSTFVFNATGKIDQTMIDKLYFVTELTERIKVKANTNENCEDEYGDYVKFFPVFVLAVRDFTLELKLDGRDVTPDEYFEHILKLKQGNKKSVVNYNLPREAIRGAFKSHHCFVFTRPVHDEKLFPKLEELEETELSAVFLKQSEEFCSFIFRNSFVKKLKQGQDMNGRLLLGMAEGYVQSINSGSVPCIESTVALVAERENQRVQSEAVNMYCQEMKSLPYPVPENDLKNAHSTAYERAMNHFRENSFFDDEGKYFQDVTKVLIEEYFKYVRHNETCSHEKCTREIQNLYHTMIAERLKEGEFTCSGGYKRYDKQMKLLFLEYDKLTVNEVKAEEVKCSFLSEKEIERETIMTADLSMEEKDKQIEKAAKEKEAAELETKLKEDQIRVEQERLAQIQSEHQEELTKIKQSYEEKEAKRAKEVEELIETRLKEKEKLLKEGFEQKAADLQAEINRLSKEKSSQGFFQKILDFVDKAASVAANVVAVRSLWRGAGQMLPRSSATPKAGV